MLHDPVQDAGADIKLHRIFEQALKPMGCHVWSFPGLPWRIEVDNGQNLMERVVWTPQGNEGFHVSAPGMLPRLLNPNFPANILFWFSAVNNSEATALVQGPNGYLARFDRHTPEAQIDAILERAEIRAPRLRIAA